MTMDRHADPTLTVELQPLDGKHDELRLDDFLEQMATLKTALRETERLVSGGEPSLYFTIKHLQKNSPARVVLEAVSDDGVQKSSPRYASYVVRSLTTNLRLITHKRRLPAKMDVATLESYREIAIPAEKRRIKVKIEAAGHAVSVGRGFREILESLVGEDERSYGSVSGRIEAINLHDKNRRFLLFPIIGPSKIVGTFRSKDRKAFAAAVDKYVTVCGKLRYKTWDKHPYNILADTITVHDSDPRPSLEALRGVSPDATGHLTTQEYIDSLHDDW
jgi:hypothetical protein